MLRCLHEPFLLYSNRVLTNSLFHSLVFVKRYVTYFRFSHTYTNCSYNMFQIDSISSFELFGSGMVGGEHMACQPVRTIRLTVSQPRPDTSITVCVPKVLETLTRRLSSHSSIDIPVCVPLTVSLVTWIKKINI